MSENTANTPNITDDINISQLIGSILQSKSLIISITLVFGVLSSIYAMLTVPVYKGNVLVQVEQNSSGLLALDEIGDMFSVESSADTEIYILRSRFIVGKAVDELNLTVKFQPLYFPYIGQFFARFHKKEGLATPKFGSKYAWGGEELNITDFKVRDDLLMQEFALIAEDQNQYSLWLDGEMLLKGYVGQPANNPAYGIYLNIAKLIAYPGTHFSLVKQSRLKATMSLQKNFKANNLGKDADIIELSLKGERKELIASILNSLSSNYVLQNVQRLAAEAENSLRFLDEQIPLIRRSLNDSENALNVFRAQHDSVDLSLETKSLLESLVTLESDISTMDLSEADLSRRFTPNHPSYLSFKRQQKDLAFNRESLNARISRLPETQQKILSLMRDFEVNQSIYISLQNKTQELAIIKASTVGNVRILDTAAVFPKPSSPNRPLIVILSGILGFMVSIIIVLFRATLNRGICSPKELEDLGLNIFAVIPVSTIQLNFDRQKNISDKRAPGNLISNQMLLADTYPADVSVEAIRSLRTSLHFSMLEAKNNILMLSSSGPEVGKSFMSANLAVVCANAGQKVLLIDADMRRGYLHDRLGISSGKGLSNFLLGECTSENIVSQINNVNIDFISRGTSPSNPSELLMSNKFSDFMKKVSENYDLVILDTPPILAVTDAAIVGRVAGTTMLVVRYKDCTVRSIVESSSRLNLSGIKVKGVIYNAVQTREGNYGYGYGYGSYTYNYSSVES